MLIYLDHEKHGSHIAYSDTDAEVCESNGWVRREKVEIINKVTNIIPIKKKRGRPPKVKK